jgi:mono/diheme cytochrome c family protein
MKLVTMAAFAFALAGCGAAPHTRAAGVVTPLAVQPVAWNAAKAPVGRVGAVADNGDVVCVFADDGATVFSAGAVVGRDAAAKGWMTAGTIPSADGGGARWIVGIDAAGHLHRLRGSGVFEDVSPRFGLGSQRVRAAMLLGLDRIGFLLDSQIAISDGRSVTRFGAPSFADLTGGGGFVAGTTTDGIDLVNATNGVTTHFALAGVKGAALDGRGRLFAITERALYASDGAGALALLYDADGADLHGLAASGDRVWFADGAELGVVEGDRVAETSGANLARDAALRSSPSGDVWVLASGNLARFAPAGAAAPGASSTWPSTIAPIFARSCAGCHQANGESGIDLSNARAWEQRRAVIRDRVVVQRSMPPRGHALSDADRDAIRAWLDAPAR